MFNLTVILVCGAGYFLASEFIGGMILRRIGYQAEKPFDPLCAGLGLTLLTAVLILLGLIGWYTPPVMVAVSVLSVIAAAVCIATRFRSRLEIPAASDEDGGRLTAFILRVSLPVLFFVCLISVLTPETRHDPYDYHLTVPTLYLAEGTIVEIPWHVFSYMPKNCEMLYGLALGTSNDSLARMIHFLFGWLCVLTVFSFTKRLASHEAGLFAAFLTATLPLFGFIVTAAYIDLARAFWELIALTALYHVWHVDKLQLKRWMLVLSALFAGMAIGTKYVSLLVFLPSYLILAVLTFFFVPRLKPLILIPGAILALLLPLAPWTTLNAIWTGNPIYPILPSVFGMDISPAERAYEFFRSHAPPLDTIAGPAVFPFTLMRINNLLIEGNALILFGAVSILLSPWWRTTPLGRRLPGYAFKGLIVSILLSTVLFLVLTDNRDGRFFFSTVALLAVLSAFFLYALTEFLQRSSSLSRTLLPILTLLMFFNAISFRHNQIQDLHEPMIPMLTDKQRARWLARRFTQYPAVEWANRNLPTGSVVLGMGYPLRFKHISGMKYGTIPFLENVSRDIPAPRLARLLDENGITHVVKPYPALPNDLDLSILEDGFLDSLLTYRGVAIYELRPPDSVK